MARRIVLFSAISVSCLSAASAPAAIVDMTFSGTVASGNDYANILGLQSRGDLGGLAVSGSVRVDTALLSQEILLDRNLGSENGLGRSRSIQALITIGGYTLSINDQEGGFYSLAVPPSPFAEATNDGTIVDTAVVSDLGNHFGYPASVEGYLNTGQSLALQVAGDPAHPFLSGTSLDQSYTYSDVATDLANIFSVPGGSGDLLYTLSPTVCNGSASCDGVQAFFTIEALAATVEPDAVPEPGSLPLELTPLGTLAAVTALRRRHRNSG